MYSQLSSHAIRSHGLLCRHARKVQLCFCRGHRDNSLVLAPTAKGVLTITKGSSRHMLAHALVPCPITVALHSASARCCLPREHHPMSGHPFTYLATRLSFCHSLTHGLDIHLEHTLTAYCMSGLSTSQEFSLATALPYKLVLSAKSFRHRCFLTLALKRPHRLP